MQGLIQRNVFHGANKVLDMKARDLPQCMMYCLVWAKLMKCGQSQSSDGPCRMSKWMLSLGDMTFSTRSSSQGFESLSTQWPTMADRHLFVASPFPSQFPMPYPGKIERHPVDSQLVFSRELSSAHHNRCGSNQCLQPAQFGTLVRCRINYGWGLKAYNGRQYTHLRIIPVHHVLVLCNSYSNWPHALKSEVKGPFTPESTKHPRTFVTWFIVLCHPIH